MRFEGGRIDQFVSDQRTISVEEKNELFREFRQRGKDFAPIAFNQIKHQITGEDNGLGNLTEEQAAYVKRSEELAQNGYQDDSDDLENKKPSWVPLIALLVIVPVLFIAGFIGGIAFAFGVLLLGASFLGFYSAKTGNVRGYTHYSGTSSGSGKEAGISIGIIGIAGALPLVFFGKFGTTGTMILMTVSIFSVVGLLMLIGFFRSLGQKMKYSEVVSANCVGYSRMIDTGVHAGRAHHRRARRFFIRTSPIFEYTYQGRSYKGIYDRMIDGINADVDIGPAEIAINPRHPEDIYHKSTGVQVKGLLVSIVCFAVAGIIIFALAKNGIFSSDRKALDTGMSGKNIISLVFSSDDKRDSILESMAEGMINSFSNKIPEEITDEMIEETAARHGYSGEWYYENVKIKNIYEHENNNYDIEFEDPTMPQRGKHGNHDNIGDTRMVFYGIEKYESNGEILYAKDIFLDVSPLEHTYIGSHGAYEG